MLSRLNDFFKGWISVFIISIVSLTFVLWGVDSYLHNGSNSETVARVASIDITKDQLHRTFERSRAQYEQVAGKPIVDEQEIRDLRTQTLEAMITRQALKLDAEKNGFYVSSQQAQTNLFSIPTFQENGHFSSERFDRALSVLQYTQHEFIEDLQSEMSVNQIRAGLILTAFATPLDVDTTTKLIVQKRDIDYLLVDAAKFTSTVPAAEIKAYYDKHPNEFKSADQVKIAYLSLSLEDLVKTMQVNDAEINQYYQNNSSNFVTPAKWRVAHINVKVPANATTEQTQAAKDKIEKIAAKIKSGADFASVAKLDSEDAITKNQGGEMPELSRGMTDPSFEAIFTKLKKPGEVSQPTQTKYGFELVKLIALTPEVSTPIASVKDKIIQNIKQEKAQKQFGDIREELANQTFSNPTTLENASKSLKLPVQTSDYFSKAQPGTGLTANPAVLSAAFSDDVLNQGNNSDVVQVSETNVVVLRVLDHKPSVVQEFTAVQKSIEEKLTKIAKLAESKAFAKKLIDPKTSSDEAKAMLSSHNFTWKAEQGIQRKTPDVPKPILEAAFSLAQSNPTDEPMKLVELEDKGTAIVRLRKVIPGVLRDLTTQQSESIRDQVANGNGLLAYELYKKDVLSNTKIDHLNVATTTTESESESE